MSISDPKIHCAMALALVLVVLMVGYAGAVRPVLEKHEFYDQAIEKNVDRLQRINSIIATRPALEAKLEKLKQSQAQSAYYLKQSTPALAATEVQEKVKRAVAQAGGTISTSQVVPPRQEGQFLKVPLNVNVTGDVQTLYKMLHALDNSKPLLFVDDLTVTSRVVRRRKTRTQSPEAQPKVQLTIQCQVVGYMRRKGS